MRSVNIREARRRLSDIVDAAQRGESVIITRRGRKVARVAPVVPAGDRTLPDLTDVRASIAIKGKGLSRTVTKTRDQERY
jgi:prevent-host-death family protein